MEYSKINFLRLNLRLLIIGSLTVTFGCSPSIHSIAPEGFAVHQDTSDLKTDDVVLSSISPTGVVYRVRTVENEPKANVDFWKERLKIHLEESGYVFKKTSPVSAKNIEGSRLEFLAPTKEIDLYFSVTLFVDKEHIILAEVAGDINSYKPLSQKIAEAITKIRIIN